MDQGYAFRDGRIVLQPLEGEGDRRMRLHAVLQELRFP